MTKKMWGWGASLWFGLSIGFSTTTVAIRASGGDRGDALGPIIAASVALLAGVFFLWQALRARRR